MVQGYVEGFHIELALLTFLSGTLIKVIHLKKNNVSCLSTVFGLNPLANSVILKHKLWE